MASSAYRWSFDRAADYYDATRSFPSHIADRITDLLARELAGRGPVLETGIGTGRIALPLVGRGVQLVGVDTSGQMLARLRAAASERGLRVPLAIGDATRLPFGDSTFGAVLYSHVLHLIPQWQAALDEAVRVLRGNGVILVDFGGGARAPWHKDTLAIFRDHGIERLRPGVSDPELASAHLAGRATSRALDPITMSSGRSLADDLAAWRAQIHSWTWAYDASEMAAATDAIERWARGQGIDADEPVTLHYTVQWWAFDLTG